MRRLFTAFEVLMSNNRFIETAVALEELSRLCHHYYDSEVI